MKFNAVSVVHQHQSGLEAIGRRSLPLSVVIWSVALSTFPNVCYIANDNAIRFGS